MKENCEPLNKCRISKKLINIALIQVSPGDEEEFAKELSNKHPVIYGGFGRYDLALIEEREDLSLIREFRESSLQSVTDFDVLSGFQWIPKGCCERSVQYQEPILGICCIKLGVERTRARSLVSEEQDIARNIYKLRLPASVDICVYCGLGWHELICIIEAPSLNELSKVVNKIKKCAQNISDITTKPCIKLSSITPIKATEVIEEVDATVMIDLVGFSPKLQQKCQKIFGDAGTRLFGLYGYRVDHTGNLDDLFHSVLKLRSSMKKIIHSTATVINHKSESFQWSSFIESKAEQRMDKLKASVKALSITQQEEPEDLLLFCNLYEITLNDSKTKDMFRSLYPFLEELFRLYEGSCRPNADAQLIEDFYFGIDCVRTAYLQRFSGIQLGNLLATKSLNISNIGFSLRVIKAAETIPFYILDRMGLSWSAFCLFSYYGKFYRSPLGVIGFPSTSVHRIHEFWGAFHESGHEVYIQLIQSDSPLLSGLLKRRNGLVEDLRKQADVYGEGKEYVEINNLDQEIDRLIKEVFSDVVDFHLGFGQNWEMYLETVWKYIIKKFYVDDLYVARMLFIYLRMGPGKNHKTSNIRVSMNNAIRELEKSAELKIPEDIVNIAKNLVLMFHACDIDSEIVRVVCNSVSNDFNSTPIAEVRASFESGIALTNLTPSTIIKALLVKPIDEKNFVPRLAALMSLYDLWGKYFHSTAIKKQLQVS